MVLSELSQFYWVLPYIFSYLDLPLHGQIISWKHYHIFNSDNCLSITFISTKLYLIFPLIHHNILISEQIAYSYMVQFPFELNRYLSITNNTQKISSFHQLTWSYDLHLFLCKGHSTKLDLHSSIFNCKSKQACLTKLAFYTLHFTSSVPIKGCLIKVN